MICSVWMLTNTIGVPEETAAENQAMALLVMESTSCSVARGLKRMELTTVDRWSGKYVAAFLLQLYFIASWLNPRDTMLTDFLLISAQYSKKKEKTKRTNLEKDR